MTMNPEAADMDPRWPVPSIDMVYVIEEPPGTWHLRDFFGRSLIAANDRSSCYFAAIQHDLTVVVRH